MDVTFEKKLTFVYKLSLACPKSTILCGPSVKYHFLGWECRLEVIKSSAWKGIEFLSQRVRGSDMIDRIERLTRASLQISSFLVTNLI